jgi:hypothetical protein
VDTDGLRAAAAALLSHHALTRAELGRRLAVRWPDHDPASLAYAAIHPLHLVQVPPRGLWRAPAARPLCLPLASGAPPTEMDAIAAEGERLLGFAGPPGSGVDVRFAQVS